MNESKTVRVVCGLITDGAGRVLLQQRSFDAEHFPGRWESPGGKVEVGETDAAALVRELREELSAETVVDTTTMVAARVVNVDGVDHYVVMYRVSLRYGRDPENITFTGAGIGWFTADEMRALALCPLNRFVVNDVADILDLEKSRHSETPRIRAEGKVPEDKAPEADTDPAPSCAVRATSWPGYGPISPPAGGGWEPFDAVSSGRNGYTFFWKKCP